MTLYTAENSPLVRLASTLPLDALPAPEDQLNQICMGFIGAAARREPSYDLLSMSAIRELMCERAAAIEVLRSRQNHQHKP